MSADMDAFQGVLKSSKNILCVAGAGLSAASGIPTFRGAGGLWRKHNATSLATPKAFKANPSLVWQFYHYRRESALKAEPNAAHRALAQFSLASIRQNLAPDSTFTLITQNVDGLSAVCLEEVLKQHPDEPQPAQPYILEMHGRIFDVKCTKCEHVEFSKASPICDALGGTEKLIDRQTADSDISVADLPRCANCGSLTRPGVVWFGERPFHMPSIDKLVEKSDLCLVVGTSSTVYPAAGYAAEVQSLGGKVAVFNLDRSDGDEDSDFLFLGPCEETLPRALGL
ncbi:NAD-dependent protein deacylase [Cylindrobasidium torrendii FP15055 ss-10]|uniref:NAD-dependent protein deacylase n=1 Tax=Cylindrobasidium torrendii FP15055 ss-10 TaxID=1314674 RepID=A0A0D7B7C2_9AGAR|nr:NAD-dependent protein deacylase [Cylindrobasidium torrendii FP15055 ss-10]